MLQDVGQAHELDRLLAEAGLPTDVDALPDASDDVEPSGVGHSHSQVNLSLYR